MDTDACLEDFLLPTPPKRRGTPVFLGFVASFWPSVVQVVALLDLKMYIVTQERTDLKFLLAKKYTYHYLLGDRNYCCRGTLLHMRP